MGARDEIGDAGIGRLGARHGSTWQRPGRKGTLFNAQQSQSVVGDGRVPNGGEKAYMQKQINRGGDKYHKKRMVFPQIRQQLREGDTTREKS